MNISSKDVYRTLLKDYPDIMGIEEMSAALGVSTKTAYKLLREGKITAIKVGRAYRIPKIHLLAYLSVLNRSWAGFAILASGIKICYAVLVNSR